MRDIATDANLAVLDEGAWLLFPQRAQLACRPAALLAQHGFRAEAADLVKLGLRGARDPELPGWSNCRPPLAD